MKVNNLTNDFIAIDTNIFEGLLIHRRGNDKAFRIYSEIYKLLSALLSDKTPIKLLVDDEGKIDEEYIKFMLRQFHQPDPPQEGDERTILIEWMRRERSCVKIYRNDELKIKIKKVLIQEQNKKENVSGVDINFVYIALKKGRPLITNDRKNIIDKRKWDGKRRKELLNIPKKSGRKTGANILTSKEGYAKIAN